MAEKHRWKGGHWDGIAWQPLSRTPKNQPGRANCVICGRTKSDSTKHFKQKRKR